MERRDNRFENHSVSKEEYNKNEKKKFLDEKKDLWIQEIEFNDGWLKAFGRGYAGPCST